jgi:Ankyrin repeats (3 copies)
VTAEANSRMSSPLPIPSAPASAGFGEGNSLVASAGAGKEQKEQPEGASQVDATQSPLAELFLEALPFIAHTGFADGETLLSAANTCQVARDDVVLWDVLAKMKISEKGYTCLMAAASSGNADRVKWLLDRGSDCNAQEKKTQTASLHIAAGAGRENVIEILLLAEGISVDVRDDKGVAKRRPLFCCWRVARQMSMQKPGASIRVRSRGICNLTRSTMKIHRF